MAHASASANPNDFILPDLGEGVHEAELIKWRVKEGDRIDELDILADMETDKAVVEVPSPRSGTIATLHGKEGEILKVGNPLVSFVSDGASAAEAKPPKKHQPAAAAPAPAKGPEEPAEPEERADAGTVVGIMSHDAKVLATPAVRRLARDLGVDINGVAGTGIGGRVTEKDVRAAGGTALQTGGTALQSSRSGTGLPTRSPGRGPARGRPDVAPFDHDEPHSALVAGGAGIRPTAPKSPPTKTGLETGPTDEVTRTPFRGVRRTIANRLRQSVDRAVHFNVMDEADVTALDTLRKRLGAASGEKVSLLPFVASAVCRVLGDARFRGMNSTVEEPDSGDAEIITHRAVHLGIATDTDSGLMVPVIRDCDRMGVLEIARAIARTAAAARDRSLARDSLIGSTFTISNVGSHAGRFATPIINYPEVGILAVGRARQAPVIRQTSAGPCFGIGLLLPLSLACDHRVVDGATAALALAEIVRLLQEEGEGLMGPARG